MNAHDHAAAQSSADVQHRPHAQLRTLEPYRISVPTLLSESLDELVERVSRRTGERPGEVRRGVELSVLKRGLESLLAEEGRR